MAALKLSEIQSAIRQSGQSWTAADNPMVRLRPQDQKVRLGLAVPPGEKERLAQMIAQSQSYRAATHVSQRDWRAKDGKDYLTPVKDQGQCGSCVAFATVATIEAQVKIEKEKPAWDVDLSEAELFFCGGARCADGWWPDDALAYAASSGVADESCMPYEDHDQACNVSSEKPDKMLTVGSWKQVTGVEDRKVWLDTSGPMIACLAIYDDFFGYSSGIYRHVTGGLAGYHAVSCVGFNDDEGYWLCKNSWSPQWGEAGFFKIGYGEAEIDTSFAMYGVSGITGTLSGDEEVEDEKGTDVADYVVLQSDANVDVLFAHVKGKWRSMPLLNGRQIDITEPAFAAEEVTVTYEGERIVSLSSWKTFAEKG